MPARVSIAEIFRVSISKKLLGKPMDRRKALQRIGAWTAPVVLSVTLPAHAETSEPVYISVDDLPDGKCVFESQGIEVIDDCDSSQQDIDDVVEDF
jgi:hypothetical protein